MHYDALTSATRKMRSSIPPLALAADRGGVAPGGAVQAALRVAVGVGAVGGGEGAGDLPERARRPRQVPGD